MSRNNNTELRNVRNNVYVINSPLRNGTRQNQSEETLEARHVVDSNLNEL